MPDTYTPDQGCAVLRLETGCRDLGVARSYVLGYLAQGVQDGTATDERSKRLAAAVIAAEWREWEQMFPTTVSA